MRNFSIKMGNCKSFLNNNIRTGLSLFVFAATAATAHADQSQIVAQESADRLSELLGCASELEPRYADFGRGIPNSAGFLSLHISPRIIRATVFPGDLPDPFGMNWELIFEVVDDEIYVLDRSIAIDPETFASSPNPLPEFPSSPELTTRAMNAFVDCGAIWLGNWEYAPNYPFADRDPESLLPPN